MDRLGGNIGAVCGFAFYICFPYGGGSKGTSMQDTLNRATRSLYTIFLQAESGGYCGHFRSDLIEGDGQVAEPIIKRVIATEGQTIRFDFDTGDVYVDEQLLDEPYIKDKTIRAVYPWKTLHSSRRPCFCHGDHRSVSKDSRTAEVGAIDTRYILGKAVSAFSRRTRRV